jgi:hypothetical protein
MRRLVLITLILLAVSACRGTNSSQSYATNVGVKPLIISIADTISNTPIDDMPFQFWLQTNTQHILATNRTKGALNYTSRNRQLDIPVSTAALKCMGHVFSTIAASNLKKSNQWLNFKKKYPYRFLELLPEVKDFYSQINNQEGQNFSQLTVPILWNGFEATGESKPSDTGFRVRGYLKWSGVLLPDGNTCLVATTAQILELLELSLKCEEGDQTSCNFPTESIL